MMVAIINKLLGICVLVAFIFIKVIDCMGRRKSGITPSVLELESDWGLVIVACHMEMKQVLLCSNSEFHSSWNKKKGAV